MACISSPHQKEVARERALVRWAKWREDHPDHAATKKQAMRAASKRHAIKHFGSEGAKRYFYAFGERIENKQVRIDAQGGKCANRACGAPVDLVTGHQDHNHETDEMRGVLCPQCNQALGLLEDNPAIVDGLAEYRKTFK
jgi:hypothetical protein